MGSLEDKIARLSPEQRGEAETFIDFLIQKGGSARPDLIPNPFLAPESSSPAEPPIIMADETPRPVVTRSNDHLPTLGDLQIREKSQTSDERISQGNRSKRKDPGLLLDWID